MAQMTGARVLWESLVREGVSTVFGYPGGAILPAYDAMIDYPIRHVLARHEQGAAHMADGYARATGRAGVVVVTSGPGATNLVTGVATAMLDSSPVVCITGQVPGRAIGFDAFQETDITGVTLPVTKHNYLVTRAQDIGDVVHEAFALATSGRPGPVLIDITKDAQQQPCTFDAGAEPRAPRLPPRCCPTHQALDEALRLIHAARRPLVLAGHGVLLSNASEALRAVVDRASIPVALTLLGLGGFPASHPLSLGMMGMHGESWVNTAIQRSDLLLACGMRFDDRATGQASGFAPHARKIHIDVDRSEIGKNVSVDVPLVGDLREVLEALLPGLDAGAHDDWLAEIRALRGDAAQRDILSRPGTGGLHAAHVIHDLYRATEGQALVVTDVGQHQMWEAQVLPPRPTPVAHHLGRPGHDGVRPARRHRRQDRLPGIRCVGCGRRRWLPDDDAGAGHRAAGRRQGERGHRQQRLPRHGPPVAGVLLRPPLLRHAPGQPGLRPHR